MALKMKWLVLTVLLTQSVAIPMSHSECPHGDFIRLSNGDSLHLDCASQCSDPAAKFQWMKVNEGGNTLLESSQSSSLSVESVSYSDGGQYACQCIPGGRECLYNVTILPEMSFKPGEEFVHYRESFDLTCTVRGFPSNTSVIKTKYGVEVPKQIRRQIDDYSTRSFVAIMEAEEGEFVCSSEIYFQGKLVEKLEKSVSVKIYEPPAIIYTTEYVLHSDADLGKPGELTCAVQISPDAGTKVAWWVNGSQIEEGHSKYVMDVVGPRESDVRKYKLIINDIQLSDIGSYLCQLSSDYVVEDVQEAWIQVDYRERTAQQESISEGGYARAGSAGVNWSRVLLILVCGACVAACAVGMWQVTRAKRQQDHPIIGYDGNHGNYKGDKPATGAYTNGMAVQRRK